MKLEDQVCSLDQAKKLRSLGVSQVGIFRWVQNFYEKAGDINDGVWGIWYTPGVITEDQYQAFNVAELGVMLPSGFDSMYLSVEKGWRGYDDDSQDYPYTGCIFPTEAICRAEMLIKYIGTMKLRVDKVNARLTD